MAQRDSHITIVMVRPDLANLPDHQLPPPLAIRTYRHGDEAAWTRIQRQADQYNDITSGGVPIGTATAWHNDQYPAENYGRVHWVAVIPSMQGRGLSKPLLSACLARMGEMGYSGAYLTTESLRIGAICLYLRFGFIPDIRSEEQQKAWRTIAENVGDEFQAVIHSQLNRFG
jgi:GNAT superfamily N-acetyltransferase